MLIEMRHKFARLEHLADDVAAADEFALHTELRDRRPIGVILDALTQINAFEHVDVFEGECINKTRNSHAVGILKTCLIRQGVSAILILTIRQEHETIPEMKLKNDVVIR